MADSEGRALVLGRRVPVSVLGGEREAGGGAALQLRRQPLVECLLGRPQALALLVQHTQQTLRPLEEGKGGRKVARVLFMAGIFTNGLDESHKTIFNYGRFLIRPPRGQKRPWPYLLALIHFSQWCSVWVMETGREAGNLERKASRWRRQQSQQQGNNGINSA